ncbi:MAG: FtsX-like permease family protein [Desulfobacterales bacterium]|nr:FtsX-like permease family protein [Desulfobacterales bacterium]
MNQPGQKTEQGSQPVNRIIILPFKKSLEIALKSLQVRFFRSLITIMSLVLAISFLSFISTSTDIANGLLATQNPEIRQLLIHSGYDLNPGDASAGSSPKQRWIVVLSLLVCVVGIVNAQLMAVTERFREIGTMKCLGALDRIILRLFLLEAGIQGVAGAGVGAVAGAAFALVNGLLRFGSISLSHVSWNDVFLSVLLATGVGFLLSLIGVLYPALLAARMEPVEAMRVEQ